MSKSNNNNKKITKLEVDDYEEELPDFDLLKNEEDLEREKKRKRQEEWTRTYGDSPIPPDLLPTFFSRTPTPTYVDMKEALDIKRKEHLWEEGRNKKKNVGKKKGEKKGGRPRNSKKKQSSKKKKSTRKKKM